VILATERLELVRATSDRLRADLAGPAELAVALAAIVPGNWPPEFYDRGAIEWMLRYVEEHPAHLQWGMYYVLDPAAPDGPTVAGVVGFKGAPDNGIVELGYSILAQFRRRGYATASTDTGHVSKDSADSSWALGRPDLVADFGYRGLHMMTENGKKLTTADFRLRLEELVERRAVAGHPAEFELDSLRAVKSVTRLLAPNHVKPKPIRPFGRVSRWLICRRPASLSSSRHSTCLLSCLVGGVSTGTWRSGTWFTQISTRASMPAFAVLANASIALKTAAWSPIPGA
jgi:hypothetical protein